MLTIVVLVEVVVVVVVCGGLGDFKKYSNPLIENVLV